MFKAKTFRVIASDEAVASYGQLHLVLHFFNFISICSISSLASLIVEMLFKSL